MPTFMEKSTKPTADSADQTGCQAVVVALLPWQIEFLTDMLYDKLCQSGIDPRIEQATQEVLGVLQDVIKR